MVELEGRPGLICSAEHAMDGLRSVLSWRSTNDMRWLCGMIVRSVGKYRDIGPSPLHAHVGSAGHYSSKGSWWRPSVPHFGSTAEML